MKSPSFWSHCSRLNFVSRFSQAGFVWICVVGLFSCHLQPMGNGPCSPWAMASSRVSSLMSLAVGLIELASCGITWHERMICVQSCDWWLIFGSSIVFARSGQQRSCTTWNPAPKCAALVTSFSVLISRSLFFGLGVCHGFMLLKLKPLDVEDAPLDSFQYQ